MSLDKELLQSIIKFAYENKEARASLLPVIKSNYKVAFEKIPLNKLEKWHKEKYGSVKYPSLLVQGKSVGFDTYINYYKKGDGYLKSGSEKVIKKAYDEYQKDHMRIPLREMVKVAYVNDAMRGVILGILKKAYAEEEESVNKGFIPPKTWELMIEWHKNKKGNIKYPSLKIEGQEVEFSTYQNYYNSGDTKLKAESIRLVQKLYDEFRKDLEKAREQSEKSEEEKYESEKSDLEKRKDLKEKVKQKKLRELKEKRINRRVDTVIDFMERGIKEIDGEFFVTKLKNLGEDEKEVFKRAEVKLKDVLKNRINNVQDYDEYTGMKKIQESILDAVVGKSKAMIETKERLLNGLVRTVEWTTVATSKNSIDNDMEIALNTFHDTDPSKKEEAVKNEYEKKNLNKKFIDDVEMKVFDTLASKNEKIGELREKLKRLSRGEKIDFEGLVITENELKSKIKRLKNEISIKEKYVLGDVTKDLKNKMGDPNITKEKKDEYDLIIKALDQEGHLFLKGDTFSLKLPDSEQEVQFNLKDTFLKMKEDEKLEIQKDLSQMFDLIQQVKSGHKSLNKNIDQIKNKMVSSLSDKQIKNGSFELEELFDVMTFGALPSISDKVASLDAYLDEKYQEGINQDLRDSMHKTTKVLMSKLKNAYTKNSITNTASVSGPEQIVQDQITSEMNDAISDSIEENRKEIFRLLKIKLESVPKNDLLIQSLKLTATGLGEKPLNDFISETVPGAVLDNTGDIIKQVALNLTENSPVRKALELFLREKLNDSSNSPIDVLLEKAQGTDFFNKALEHLKENNSINDFLSYTLKALKVTTYDLPDALNKVSDAIGFGEGGFFESLGENETVDFVGDMLGNAAGGVIKSVGMYTAGEMIGNHFQEEFLDLYGGQDRLVQEILAGEKIPKEEEEKYHKRLQQIEDSFLTDEQWEEKYRGQTYKAKVQEPGRFWGTNEVEKEFQYKKETRGRLRKEASQKAKDTVKEDSALYQALNSIDLYKNMAQELKDGKINILSRVNSTQLSKIKKELKSKSIDSKAIDDFVELHKKIEDSQNEAHGEYDPSYTREKAVSEMCNLLKDYETHSKGAFFRGLYLQGKRGEEGEKIEGIGSQQWRKLKMGAENKKDMPLLLKLRNNILTLKLSQKLDKHKIDLLDKGEVSKVLYGEKPIDKTSFEISKAMNKKILKQKLM